MPLTPEQQKEIAQAFAANRARQALTRKQRFEAGEFSVELQDFGVGMTAIEAGWCGLRPAGE
jgi:hypothetical protein